MDKWIQLENIEVGTEVVIDTSSPGMRASYWKAVVTKVTKTQFTAERVKQSDVWQNTIRFNKSYGDGVALDKYTHAKIACQWSSLGTKLMTWDDLDAARERKGKERKLRSLRSQTQRLVSEKSHMLSKEKCELILEILEMED